MENNPHQLWADCLTMIRERYGEQYRHWYDVWFSGIQCESYDADTHTLLLQVPNIYVYEYLEERCVKQLQWATQAVFQCNVKINYRLCEKSITAGIDLARKKGIDPLPQRPHIAIADARVRMEAVMRQLLADRFRWLPCYDDVVRWLTDNRRRCLLITDGGNGGGQGKTFIARSVLPVLFSQCNIAYCTAVDMMAYDNAKREARIDQLLRHDCVIIDNLGSELDTEAIHYGRHRRPFEELCDAVQQSGLLLIVTTHLWPNIKRLKTDGPDGHQGDPDPRRFPSIEERYGHHVYDILRNASDLAYFYGDL